MPDQLNEIETDKGEATTPEEQRAPQRQQQVAETEDEELDGDQLDDESDEDGMGDEPDPELGSEHREASK